MGHVSSQRPVERKAAGKHPSTRSQIPRQAITSSGFVLAQRLCHGRDSGNRGVEGAERDFAC